LRARITPSGGVAQDDGQVLLSSVVYFKHRDALCACRFSFLIMKKAWGASSSYEIRWPSTHHLCLLVAADRLLADRPLADQPRDGRQRCRAGRQTEASRGTHGAWRVHHRGPKLEPRHAHHLHAIHAGARRQAARPPARARRGGNRPARGRRRAQRALHAEPQSQPCQGRRQPRLLQAQPQVLRQRRLQARAFPAQRAQHAANAQRAARGDADHVPETPRRSGAAAADLSSPLAILAPQAEPSSRGQIALLASVCRQQQQQQAAADAHLARRVLLRLLRAAAVPPVGRVPRAHAALRVPLLPVPAGPARRSHLPRPGALARVAVRPGGIAAGGGHRLSSASVAAQHAHAPCLGGPRRPALLVRRARICAAGCGLGRAPRGQRRAGRFGAAAVRAAGRGRVPGGARRQDHAPALGPGAAGGRGAGRRALAAPQPRRVEVDSGRVPRHAPSRLRQPRRRRPERLVRARRQGAGPRGD
jgi:hypothetical protein